MMVSCLVFWQDMPSMHQADLLIAIQKRFNIDVYLICKSDVTENRLIMGWYRPALPNINLIIAPSSSEKKSIIEQTSSGVHIFSGLSGAYFIQTMLEVRKTSAIIGLLSEDVETSLFTEMIKRFVYTYKIKKIQPELNFILSIGENARLWYQQCGFDGSKIYDFGYFIDNKMYDISARLRSPEEKKTKFIFIGNIYKGKGLDLLLSGLIKIKSQNWHLDIVGSGPDLKKLQAFCVKNNIMSEVSFLGVIDNHKVHSLIGASDYLILPSRYDGWGAVINEALVQGTSVLVSEACGSKALIQSKLQGYVFSACSLPSIINKLQKMIELGPRSSQDRARLMAWADAAISTKTIANYFHDIIEDIMNNRRQLLTAPWEK